MMDTLQSFTLRFTAPTYLVCLLVPKKTSDRSFIRRASLRVVLIVSFVLQIFGAVGLTGYVSLWNGQKAVNKKASQLRNEVRQRIDQHLDSYIELLVRKRFGRDFARFDRLYAVAVLKENYIYEFAEIN